MIAFNRRMHVKGRSQFVVDFVGRAGAVQISAKQLNSSTLILETPGKLNCKVAFKINMIQ